MPFRLLKYINVFFIVVIIYIITNGVYTKYVESSAYNLAEATQVYLLNLFNVSQEYIVGRNSSQQLLEIIRSTPLFLIVVIVFKSFFINYDLENKENNKFNLILISLFLAMSAIQIPFFYKWCQIITYIVLIIGLFDILSSSIDTYLNKIIVVFSVIYISILFIVYYFSYYYFGGYFYSINYIILMIIILLYLLVIIFFNFNLDKKILFISILVIVILIERILFYNYFFKYTYNSNFTKPEVVSSYSDVEVRSALYLRDAYSYSDVIIVTDPYTLSITKGLTGFNGFYSSSNIEEMSESNKKYIRLILKYILASNCSKKSIKSFKNSLISFMKDSSLNHSEVSESITRNQYPSIEPGYFDTNFFESLLIIVTPRTLQWLNGNSSYVPSDSELDFHQCNKFLYEVKGVDRNFLLFRLNKSALKQIK